MLKVPGISCTASPSRVLSVYLAVIRYLVLNLGGVYRTFGKERNWSSDVTIRWPNFQIEISIFQFQNDHQSF